MYTGSQDLYLGVYTDLIIGYLENVESHISRVNWLDKSLCFRALIISHFSFLIALLSVFRKKERKKERKIHI